MQSLRQSGWLFNHYQECVSLWRRMKSKPLPYSFTEVYGSSSSSKNPCFQPNYPYYKVWNQGVKIWNEHAVRLWYLEKTTIYWHQFSDAIHPSPKGHCPTAALQLTPYMSWQTPGRMAGSLTASDGQLISLRFEDAVDSCAHNAFVQWVNVCSLFACWAIIALPTIFSLTVHSELIPLSSKCCLRNVW